MLAIVVIDDDDSKSVNVSHVISTFFLEVAVSVYRCSSSAGMS